MLWKCYENMVYVTLRFEGLPAQILENAVKKGIGNTKSQVLTLGLLKLNQEYHLTEDEDMEDLKTAVSIMNRVRSGKEKIHSETEIMKKLAK